MPTQRTGILPHDTEHLLRVLYARTGEDRPDASGVFGPGVAAGVGAIPASMVYMYDMRSRRRTE